MAIPTIFEACAPRQDILEGAITDSDFAADLAKVLKGKASRLYQDPALFFANTHPTRGLKNLLQNVFGQLARNNQAVSSIFRLDTNYGGGKTHALIALAHVAAGMGGVADISEFIDPGLVPRENIRVAAFKVLAPMRNAERMRQVARGMELMREPEAAYWLGMAMHRKNPRRVLSALRLLLTE